MCKCKYAGPAHADIQNGRYPLRAVDPESLDDDSGDRNTPHNREQNDSGFATKHEQTDRSVASGDQDTNHHMVDFFQNFINPRRAVKCMVCGAGCIEQNQADRINRNGNNINAGRLSCCFDQKWNSCKNCH